MSVIYQERPSDSPFVQTIWQTQATSDGADVVVADSSWDMLVFQREGKLQLSVWGAMTQAQSIPHDEGSECLGIRFKLGTAMPHLQTHDLLDAGAQRAGDRVAEHARDAGRGRREGAARGDELRVEREPGVDVGQRRDALDPHAVDVAEVHAHLLEEVVLHRQEAGLDR